MEDVEGKGRRNEQTSLGIYGALLGSELVGTVARTDGDCERVAASARGELNHLFGPGVVRFCGRNFIFNTSENAELSLNGYVELMSVVNDLLGQCDILFEGKVRTVNHHRGETIVDALLANLEGVTMVEVKNNLRILATEFLGVLNSTLGKVAEDGTVGISASTLRHLHDDGRLGLNSSLNDSLHLLHCVEVESGDGIATSNGLLEHLTGVHQTEIFVIYHGINIFMRLFPNRKGYFRQQNYKSLLTYQKRMDFFWKMSGGGERKMQLSVVHTSYLKTAM